MAWPQGGELFLFLGDPPLALGRAKFRFYEEDDEFVYMFGDDLGYSLGNRVGYVLERLLVRACRIWKEVLIADIFCVLF